MSYKFKAKVITPRRPKILYFRAKSLTQAIAILTEKHYQIKALTRLPQ